VQSHELTRKSLEATSPTDPMSAGPRTFGRPYARHLGGGAGGKGSGLALGIGRGHRCVAHREDTGTTGMA